MGTYIRHPEPSWIKIETNCRNLIGMSEWCSSDMIKVEYSFKPMIMKSSTNITGWVVYFSNETDATNFALKWS